MTERLYQHPIGCWSNIVIFQRKIIQIIGAHPRHATVCRHTWYDTKLPVSQKSIFCQSFTHQLAQNRHYKGTTYALPKANKVSATLNPDGGMMKELFYGSTAEVFQEPVLLQFFKLPAFLLLNFSLLKQQWLTQSFWQELVMVFFDTQRMSFWDINL